MENWKIRIRLERGGRPARTPMLTSFPALCNVGSHGSARSREVPKTHANDQTPSCFGKLRLIHSRHGESFINLNSLLSKESHSLPKAVEHLETLMCS